MPGHDCRVMRTLGEVVMSRVTDDCDEGDECQRQESDVPVDCLRLPPAK